ncbi:MAG TPA: adenylate kinase [Microscillaceae bacterium]|jgi:adenylate kinase|nr:adenylate kinase [Microscillaceae bacterium]
MINLILFGPPGAGKGTQSEKIIKQYNLVHLSTGDLLRSEVAAGTELGNKAKDLMSNGILVPDEIVIGMINNKIKNNPEAKGFIFDGFPRTIEQANALEDLLRENKLPGAFVIALEVDEDELTKRILERGKVSGRPDDQNETLIKQRFKEYHTKTSLVANYYKNKERYAAVNGLGEIEDITKAIAAIIESLA